MTDVISLHDNLVIHGDNLLALKALLPTYAGKVKCIYIDPPYNTGNEAWVYNDRVNSPLIREWIGQVVGKEGEDFTRHDKWLCMMMPRLKLLKELLSNDGLIFISIDNNEVHRLRMLAGEVFGEENFISQIANINNPQGRSDDKYVAGAHEYLVVYKRKNDPKLYGWTPDEKVLRRYNKTDKKSGRKCRLIDLRKTGDADRREDRPGLFYYFLYEPKTELLTASRDETIPEGYIQIQPVRKDGTEGRWRWELEKSVQNIGRLVAKIMPARGIWTVYEIDYLLQDERITPTTVWCKKAFNSQRGTEQFRELGFDKNEFPNPKPLGLLKHILEFSTAGNDIVLDSFAGSGTTAHAVLELNKEDKCNRKFILVECEDYADRITAERVRRAITGVPNAKNELLAEGLCGSFSYFELGDPIEIEPILKGDRLPSYLELARYVFYVATGEEFDETRLNESEQLVGRSTHYDIYMLYKPDLDYLKQTALTLNIARKLREQAGSRQLLVFAPAKYVETPELEELNIDFCQLPFEIYNVRT